MCVCVCPATQQCHQLVRLSIGSGKRGQFRWRRCHPVCRAPPLLYFFLPCFLIHKGPNTQKMARALRNGMEAFVSGCLFAGNQVSWNSWGGSGPQQDASSGTSLLVRLCGYVLCVLFPQVCALFRALFFFARTRVRLCSCACAGCTMQLDGAHQVGNTCLIPASFVCLLSERSPAQTWVAPCCP